MPAPSPVSGVAAAGAAVREVIENRQPLLDDVVRALAADVGDETNAAGIVLEKRIVQSLRVGSVRGAHDSLPHTDSLPRSSAAHCTRSSRCSRSDTPRLAAAAPWRRQIEPHAFRLVDSTTSVSVRLTPSRRAPGDQLLQRCAYSSSSPSGAACRRPSRGDTRGRPGNRRSAPRRRESRPDAITCTPMKAVMSRPSLRASSRRSVAGDDPALLELLDPLDHCRRRQPHLVTDLGDRRLAVILEPMARISMSVGSSFIRSTAEIA